MLDPRELLRALAPLPLELLAIESDVLTLLAAAGITTFGEAAALPRDALARRCGADLVATLDRALARCPDPRVPFVPPPQFESRLELPVPVADVEALSFAVNRLVHELSAWLSARGLGAVRLSLTLTHEHYLQQRGVVSVEDLKRVDVQVRTEVADAMERARAAPDAGAAELGLDDVYACNA